ncbi:Lrp/AsnC family transcriptional regulator [Aminipila luticellarii]|nr:Lrp/AsnC family transcriptional regulator [Aminipila luticellarii]
MDEIDVRILELLQENSRKPLSEISAEVHLSIPAVSERLKKLENSGAIKSYTAILNPDSFGKALFAYCFTVLKNKDPEKELKFKRFIENEPDILECYCLTGEYEYLLKIRTDSTSSLESLLVRMRKEAPIIKTSTSIVLSTKKEEPSIPPCITKCKNPAPQRRT